MTAQEIITNLLTTGLSGVLAWYAIRNIPRLAALEERVKAFVAFGLSALLCVLAYCASVGLGYTPNPATWQGWLEALIPVIAWAYTVSQGSYWAMKSSR